MPILYALYRNGHPTGTVREIASPHELKGRTPQLTRKRQATQQRLISTLDRSEKWERTAAPAPAAPAVDVDALVDQRVAEKLAALQAAKDAEAATPKPAARSRKTTKDSPAADETPAS